MEKRRYDVDVEGLTWQVDAYTGMLEGLVTADVELPTKRFPLVLPDWVGREVTADAGAAMKTEHPGEREPAANNEEILGV